MDRFITQRCVCGGGVIVAILLVTLSTSPARGADNKKPPLQFAFHVDVLKDDIEMDEKDPDRPTAPTELNVIGVPLTFGTRQVSFEDGPGLAAGLYADYEALLSDRMTFTARAALSKTRYLKDRWGSDEASVAGEWRYRGDHFEWAFEPSWRVTLVENEATARDYGAELRLKNDFGSGLSIVNGLRYDRYDTLAAHNDHANASASSGLSYRFGPNAIVDITFDAVYTLSQEGGRKVTDIDDLRNVASNMGPSIAMAFPLSDEIEFAAAYRFCRSTDELPRFTEEDQRVEDKQHLNMRLAWHNRDQRLRDFDISAGYAFDGWDTKTLDEDTMEHTVSVALAVNF